MQSSPKIAWVTGYPMKPTLANIIPNSAAAFTFPSSLNTKEVNFESIKNTKYERKPSPRDMNISDLLGIFSVVITDASMVHGSAMFNITLLREDLMVVLMTPSLVVTKPMIMMRKSSIIFMKIGRKSIMPPRGHQM